MPATHLGRTLVIANPAAHSGKGAAGAQVVQRFFEVYQSATTDFDLQLTSAPGDAFGMAAAATTADTVIALGGDGVIHEVLGGLMTIAPERRPQMGIVPMGSGNDFARTLGMTLNNPERAISELLSGLQRTIDVGYVTSDSCPEGAYFLETLSFGLDAAIALDTTVRRASGTKQEGAGLFVTSSIKTFLRARKSYPCTVVIDGEEPLQLEALIFAVQNGPTYGGGFRICPSAVPNDGLLDLCYNVSNPNVARIMTLLASARFGKHTRSRAIRLRTAREVSIGFDQEVPPCQTDGEEFPGSRFEISLLPQALRVVVPKACSW